MRLNRWQGVVTLLVIGLVLSGCGSPAPSGPAWFDQVHAVEPAPSPGNDDGVPVTGGCGLLGDGETPAGGSGGGSGGGTPSGGAISAGVGNDPYTATGARQVPGPGMRLSTPPPSPVIAVVAAPVDPDEHVAARQPDGVATGPIPSPKVIGTTASPAPEPSTGTTGSQPPSTGSGGTVPCPGGGL